MVVALALAIPIVLLPVAYVWYLNLGGIARWMKRHGEEEAPEQEKAEAPLTHAVVQRAVNE